MCPFEVRTWILKMMCRMRKDADVYTDVMTIADLPIEILRAELRRRQDGADRPACGSGKRGAYNTPIHVFALILILSLSTIGTAQLLD
jgi:hypothetical protein